MGYAYCLKNAEDVAVPECMIGVHDYSIRVRLHEPEEDIDCGVFEKEVKKSYQCKRSCSEVLDKGKNINNIKCCDDTHCNGNQVCTSGFCFPGKTLRFSLTWEGNDDLDLHAKAPTKRKWLWRKNRRDKKFGGLWKGRFGNRNQGTADMYDYYAEEISYGSCNTGDEYKFKVTRNKKAGQNNDTYTLKVYKSGVEVQAYKDETDETGVLTFVC